MTSRCPWTASWPGRDQSARRPHRARAACSLHEWHLDPQGEDRRIVEEWSAGVGAYVMGRNMFGPGRGEWDLDWTGWWGDEPPYGVPVFVLTHHPRASRRRWGATTFHFVTDGVEAAVAQAREAAEGPHGRDRGRREHRATSASTAGLVDELHLHVVPLTLGDGRAAVRRRAVRWTSSRVQVVAVTRAVTHVKYRVPGSAASPPPRSAIATPAQRRARRPGPGARLSCSTRAASSTVLAG